MNCPACSGSVTLEVGPDQPLSTSLTDVLLAADEDERINVSRNCWNCGWHEERQIRVESIDTTDGDEVAVKRASLVEEITDELAEIERLDTLEDTLTEVRRQQRLEPSTDSTEDDTTE
ncbi:hypothetical protein [Natronorubrum thiooxidans]|uniref:Uncharacterized protein n=1 Tax=Natronorubrum thiooxidans TaxID=308853 RepID=A0A1N7H9Q6_9EURY|nr:hypothetical protein [Natronorubrum thiooxidans]SIS21552.1 hypothetical protein SAMN05421752_1378 [Natronorubrum thiooxidans]